MGSLQRLRPLAWLPEMELPSLDDEPETARAPMAEAAPTLDPLGAADDLSIASSGLAPLSSGTPDNNTLEFDLGDLLARPDSAFHPQHTHAERTIGQRRNHHGISPNG